MSEIYRNKILRLNVPKFAEHAMGCPQFSQTIGELIAGAHLHQSKEACGRGALALVVAAIIKTSDKQLFVEHKLLVLGAKSKVTGKRGKLCVSDLAILDNSDNSESTSKEEVSGTDLQDNIVLMLVTPPQNQVVVVEYKSKLYETLDRVNISDVM